MKADGIKELILIFEMGDNIKDDIFCDIYDFLIKLFSFRK